MYKICQYHCASVVVHVPKDRFLALDRGAGLRKHCDSVPHQLFTSGAPLSACDATGREAHGTSAKRFYYGRLKVKGKRKSCFKLAIRIWNITSGKIQTSASWSRQSAAHDGFPHYKSELYNFYNSRGSWSSDREAQNDKTVFC